MRYGIIGTGMMGVEHLRNLERLPGAEVVAVADPDERSRQAAIAAVAGGQRPAVFEGHRQLLAWDGCDAVVVATPNMTHAAVLDDVLAAPVHVLVEKPLCTTVPDCRRVIDAARSHPRVVWVGLEYRYIPAVARLIAEVRGGTVGSVRMVAIREHRGPFLAKVGDWNRFNRNTGGTLVEKCCHFFDLMTHIVAAPPVRVMASGAQDVNHLDERYGGEASDILDNAYVIVEYTSGARAVLDLCMFAEASRYQEEVAVVGDAGKIEARMLSSLQGQGTVRVGRRAEGWMGVSDSEVREEKVRYQGSHYGSSYLEHLDFWSACDRGQAPEVSLEDGLLSVALGVAAHRSIDEARPVAVDEVLRP